MLEEAQKLLKSLRIAALRVPDSSASPNEGESSEGIGEREEGTEAVIPKVCAEGAHS